MTAFWKRKSGGAGSTVVGTGGPGTPAEKLRLLEEFEKSGKGWFWSTDAKGCITYISQSAAKSLGRDAASLHGTRLVSLFVQEKDESTSTQAGHSERTLPFLMSMKNTIANAELRLDIPDDEVWWSLHGRPQFDADGTFTGYRGNGEDITEERQSRQDASRMALFDSLTGLANRHHMTKRLESILASYKAAGRSCAMMMLDLDRFKQVNDTLGHPAGDELLKQVAQRLQRIVGSNCEIGRLGGDEFQVILPDMDDRGRLGELASRVIQMISQPYSIEGSRCVIGTSVGIAIAPYDGVSSGELVRSADLALYAAKGGGKGQYRFFSNELKDEAEERRMIEEDLRDALAKGQLEMHYQPVVRVEDNTVTGFEALMRWHHPARGPIGPGVFISVAEETDLILALGEWALRTACDNAAKWPETVRVAVNVSAVQFASERFPKVVASVLANSGLRPDRLELELTETVFMGDRIGAEETFRSLKSLGVRLVLDDFGTGYSSLGYLRTVPIDKIKIDRTFVETCTEKGSNNQAIIAAIVNLAAALAMETTVEGVEALDQLSLVTAQGGTHVQGFIYSRAISPDAVLLNFERGEFRIEPSGPQCYRPNRRTVFRRIGVIHEDHRYEAMLRDISRTGARIEGMLNVPEGTELVLDLGEGQLAVCIVRRSNDAQQGVEFEMPLISDGAGGFCTRHRISPYALAAAGMPLTALGPGASQLALNEGSRSARPAFMQVETSGTKGSRAA